MYSMRHVVAAAPAAPQRTTAKLLKTGQTVSYRTGDDGDLEAGRSTSFTVLAENNPFGNTNRFTDELGGQTYTNNIVIDWSTYDGSSVLGYRRTTNGVDVTWDNAIDGALAVSIGSFTSGWRLPNMKELQNIQNVGLASSDVFNYSPFNLSTNTNSLWCSSTLGTNSLYSWRFGIYGTCDYQGKSSTYKYIPCRTFTVTGTTLS